MTGNYVMVNYGGHWELSEATPHTMERDPRDVKPIPLTDEELVKLGFVKQANMKSYFMAFQGRYHYVCLDEELPYYKIGTTRVQVHIQYVHQLQNLYYALTQTTLQYTH